MGWLRSPRDPRSSTASVAPGVYVVLRMSSDPPAFSDVNTAGHFKGKDPTVLTPLLEAAWVPGAVVLYIGKASGGTEGPARLRKRLDEYRLDSGDGHGASKAQGCCTRVVRHRLKRRA